MGKYFLLFIVGILMVSCSNISVSDEEVKPLAVNAINTNLKNKNKSDEEITYWFTKDVAFNKFDSVEMVNNGVKTKAIPFKVKGKSIIAKKYWSASRGAYVKYYIADNEVTINVYRNEVKELKYKIVDEKVKYTEKAEYLLALQSRTLVSYITGKIVSIKDSTITINENGTEHFAIISDDDIFELLSNYFKPGDVVSAVFDNSGPRATGGFRLLFVEPKR